MKYRMGFVSNSSSSSFLLGIAKIKNKEKLISWLEEIGIKKYDYSIFRKIEFKEHVEKFNSDNSKEYFYPDMVYFQNDSIALESFDYSKVKISSDSVQGEDYLFTIYCENNEGDPSFRGEYSEELDYDISINFLPANQQELYKLMLSENDLVERGNFDSVKFGAGRNG
jgi:hypothetical protein